MSGSAENLFTVESAKEWLRRQALKSGGHCPVCNRFTKVYRRQITSSMARFLINFWNEHKDFEFHHVGRNYRKCGDYAKLSYWGLIEPRGDAPDSKKHSGYWRMTTKGHNFVCCSISVRKTASVYDSQVLGFEGPWVTIRDALNNRFDYEELMG